MQTGHACGPRLPGLDPPPFVSRTQADLVLRDFLAAIKATPSFDFIALVIALTGPCLAVGPPCRSSLRCSGDVSRNDALEEPRR